LPPLDANKPALAVKLACRQILTGDYYDQSNAKA